MSNLKEKVKTKIEKIPEDRIAELYDVVHFFRIGIESQKKVVKNRQDAALNYIRNYKIVHRPSTKTVQRIYETGYVECS